VDETQKALKNASRNIRAVSADAQKLLKNTDGQIQPVGKRAQEALVSVRKALDQTRNTLVTINGFVGERSDTRHKLNASLDEIAAAAQSLHSLMDYLERHPEALLKGKGGRGG
jgi:paraquat-inducible protein B